MAISEQQALHEQQLRAEGDRDESRFLCDVTRKLEEVELSDDLEKIAPGIVTSLQQSINAESVVLLTKGDCRVADLPQFHLTAWAGAEALSEQVVIAIADRYAAQLNGAPIIKTYIADGDHDCFPGVTTFIMAPLGSPLRRFGWLLAINRRTVETGGQDWLPREHAEFGEDDVRLVASAAAILASHGRHFALFHDLQQLVVSVLHTLVTAIEAKDPYTCGHSERVALFGRALAQAVGYDRSGCDRIYLAGLLHDIGKIGISDSTLRKAGPLTPEEFAEVKRHPDLGWCILQDLGQLRHVLPAVVHHHERVDGQGYPDGLTGDTIPLDGRVLAVADAFDAMTSDRPYRDGMPIEKACQILHDGAGTQWDADLVKVFRHILPEILRLKQSYQQEVPIVRSGPVLEYE